MEIAFKIEDRESVIAQVKLDGKIITHENLTDLDENGRPTNCYFEVVDAQPLEPDLLAAADERILELEYENLTLKEGLLV